MFYEKNCKIIPGTLIFAHFMVSGLNITTFMKFITQLPNKSSHINYIVFKTTFLTNNLSKHTFKVYML